MKPRRRHAYTLMELLVSTATASLLMGGMASSIYIASKALKVENGAPGVMASNSRAVAQLLRDVRHAYSFSERTDKAITFTVPDRNSDGRPETLRYAWSGTAGAPLTYTYNSEPTQTVVRKVNNLNLQFTTRLMLARTVDGGAPDPPLILLVSGQAPDGDGGIGSPTFQEQERLDLMAGWGFDTQVINQQATQAEFDSEMADADAVYVSGQVNPGTVGTKLNSTPIGVVTESFDNANNLLIFNGAFPLYLGGTTINIDIAGHYITQEHLTGLLNILDSAQQLKWTPTAPAADADILASTMIAVTPYPSLIAIEAGQQLADGSTAAGNRVMLPWGDNGFEVAELNDDGQTLMRRAIEWSMLPPNANVAYKSFSEQKQESDATNIVIDLPSGVQDGDLLVAAVSTEGDTTGSLSPPAGWNLVAIDQRYSEVTLAVWWKNAAAEPANHNFTWSGNGRAYGWIMRFTGHDTSTPIDAVAVETTGSNETYNPPSPAVTTTVDNTLIVRIGGFDDADINVDDPGLPFHTPITMDEAGGDISGGAGFIEQPLAGESGASTFTLTKREQAVAITIAIRPEASP